MILGNVLYAGVMLVYAEHALHVVFDVGAVGAMGMARLVSEFLGLPGTGSSLYPAVLGAVFVGIGVALLLERFQPSFGGLGLGGAMSINLIFGLVLGGWLLLSDADLPLRGVAVLAVLALILVGISAGEAVSLSRRDPAP